VYALIVDRQRLGKKLYRGNEYTRKKNRIIVGRIVFYVVRAVSRKVDDQFFPELLACLNNGTTSTIDLLSHLLSLAECQSIIAALKSKSERIVCSVWRAGVKAERRDSPTP
jgi:hypothetical protein